MINLRLTFDLDDGGGRHGVETSRGGAGVLSTVSHSQLSDHQLVLPHLDASVSDGFPVLGPLDGDVRLTAGLTCQLELLPTVSGHLRLVQRHMHPSCEHNASLVKVNE